MNFTDRDELAARRKRKLRRQRADVFLNFLTVCTVLATLALIAVFMILFSNPNLPINPFPPPTMPVLVNVPTSTATLVFMPPTWTPTAKATDTLMPPTVTTTPDLTATAAAVAMITPTAGNMVFPFVLQGEPAAVRSVLFKPNSGCSWQGVAGEVEDMQGRPVLQIAIELKGIYNGKTIDMKTISGTHTEYGDSGYEFQLGTAPLDSSSSLSIQVVDQSFLPLSEKVIFNTYATCDKNLVMINFKQVR